MLLFGRIAKLPQKHATRIERLCLADTFSLSLRRPLLNLQPLRTLRWRISEGWTTRQVASAHTGPRSSDSTIQSLDSILGSEDKLDEAGTEVSEEPGSYPGGETRRSRRWKVPDAAARRVRPLYVYVIYYCFIVVYLATAWLQATDGDLAASVLVDGLVNDHLSVASGQVPRLVTSGFVCDGPLQLFMQLATLLTVGAEAEALLGYSLFWAVYWLANLGGGLADAALSELPVTFGPANAAAGMVGALAAYYVRNMGLEEHIAAARQAVRRRRRQILDGFTSDGAAATPLTSREPLEEMETEVELLPLLSVTFTSRMGSEARGLLNVLVALVMAGQGLLDFGDASSSASWIGLIAAFWTGLLLTFGAGPHYEVQYTLPEFPQECNGSSSRSSIDSVESNNSRSSSSGARVKPCGTASSASSSSLDIAVSRGLLEDAAPGRPAADDDGLTVVDVCPPSRRQAVLGAYVALLTAVILGWMAWMGTDI